MYAVRNDNLCSFTGVSPKTATLSYPEYDTEPRGPRNPLLPPLELKGELARFNKEFERRRGKVTCCQPHLPPRYRPVLTVPPAQFWTPVDLCNSWHFFDRYTCCDVPQPYNWINDSCPTPYCRPGGKAVPPHVVPYPNMGLYFPPCDVWRVKC